MTKKEYYERVKALREQGKNYREIADELGKTRKSVQQLCKRHKELQYSEKERENAKHINKGIVLADFGKKVEEKYCGTFELISVGRPNNRSERPITIKCRTCGSVKTISSITLRKNNRVEKCKNCEQVEKAKQEVKQEVISKYIKLQEQTKKDKQKAQRRVRTKQIKFSFCSCGALLESGRTVCDECKHDNLKETYRRKDVIRRARMRTVPKDKGITLRKLYQRDNGVCYLCGRVCDWNDCRWDGKTFIVGKNYPTVEHLIPIVQGGSDTWENIRLACLSCNSKKGGRAIA